MSYVTPEEAEAILNAGEAAHMGKEPMSHSPDPWKRIAACVNAMKGIEDPEAFMAQLQRVMLHRGKSQIPFAACQSLREELAKLAELGEFEVYT